MKKFIKAVVVASVLVSANSAFATISKSGATGTGGVACPHKLNAGLWDATADKQVAAAVNTNVKVIGGTVVK
ncbi:hypothetical protein D3C87_1438300 [compost metagenome]